MFDEAKNMTAYQIRLAPQQIQREILNGHHQERSRT
jgi:hypothetical protein